MRQLPRLFTLAGVFLTTPAFGTNPLILDQFTADPTARVFEGRMYVYPSHDIPPVPGKSRADWFCMEDYHVFSSENLTTWMDHGVIVSQTTVPWVDPDSYSMWAPDCVFKNGTYYFYFPAKAKSGDFRIGVATSDKPQGPFKPQATPIEGAHGIDPCVLIDKDGRAYLYYSEKKIFVAKLKDNLLELESPPEVIDNLPTKGLLEGPFVFERRGIYYLTYPHVENKIERLEYATSDNPLGPFKPAGVILDESPTGCWTVHHSIVEYRGEWYLFYHDRDLSPHFDKNRSIRADRLFFNDDGSIRKVVPTHRGVGVVTANDKIEIDRYSATSGNDVAVSFLDPVDPKKGWKTSLKKKSAWVRFDQVDFGQSGYRRMQIRTFAPKRGSLEVRQDHADGPILARIEIEPGSEWRLITVETENRPTGVHDLIVTCSGKGSVEVDWVRFE